MRLDSIFETWTKFALESDLIPRDVDLEALAISSHHSIVAVTGLRRSGKSSILMLLGRHLKTNGKKVAYVNAEDYKIRYEEDGWDQLISWFGPDEEGYLMIDEVTAKEHWAGFLANTYELMKGKIHLIVTSSRSGLSSPPRELRGRMLQIEVFPLNFPEFLRFRGMEPARNTIDQARDKRMLDDFLRLGGFPEITLMKSEPAALAQLTQYYRDIVMMDIAQVRGYELSEVEQISRHLISSTYFSASKTYNQLKSIGYKTSKAKVLEIERIASESYIFFFPRIFAHGIKDRGIYPRKCFCGDNGFYTAVLGQSSRGRRLENAVFLSMRRDMGQGDEVCYWKNARGNEVDLVVMRGSEAVLAVQVCVDMKDEKTRGREIASLVECARSLGTRKNLIITETESWKQEIDGVEIEALTAIDWFISPRKADRTTG